MTQRRRRPFALLPLAAALALAPLTAAPADAAPAYVAKPAAKAPAVSVSESAGTAVVTVKLARKAGKKLTLRWATVPGTAKAGSDFRAAGGKVTIKKGKRSARVRVGIVDDRIAEPTESFGVTFSGGVKVRPGKVPVTIRDDDSAGGGGGGGSATKFPQTISGPVSGTTKVATFTGGTVPNDPHVTWSGTITWTYQPRDPHTGFPWSDGQVHYAISAATLNWSVSGSCTGAGTLTAAGLTGAYYVDDTRPGSGFDEDAAAFDYFVDVAPVSGAAGTMSAQCDADPALENVAGRVGQGGFGGTLLYNGYASADEPVSNRVTANPYVFTGHADPTALTYDVTWNLTGSGVAAYPPA